LAKVDRAGREKRTMLKNGKLHRVSCGWCGLKMACNCFLNETTNHLQVLCPKCQVTEILNEMFATKDPPAASLSRDDKAGNSACTTSEGSEG
jgi:hypothetical protein